MRSRRPRLSRPFTIDFRPEVYPQTDIDWVTKTKRKEGLPNAFLPWHRVGADGKRDGRFRHRVDGVQKALEAINS